MRQTLRWRLFELSDKGHLKTLFHGVEKSRTIKEGRWYEAEVRPVRDGTSKTWYLSGFHVMRDVSGLNYVDRFTADRELVAVQVEVIDTWEKPTNPSILLARWLRVPEGAYRWKLEEMKSDY